MIKYPKGVSINKNATEIKAKKYKRNSSNNYANMGMNLESDVIKSCNYFLTQKMAVIYKRPTPIRITKMDKNHPGRISEAFFAEKSTTDFVGVYRSKYIDFECKETATDTLEFHKIRPQQITHLNSVKELGGIGFFMVSFTKRNEVYILDASYVIERVLNEKSHQGYKREFFIEHGYLLEQGYIPRLEILKALDKAYFDTPFDPSNPTK